jgi:manganese efflux pump family protein
MFEVMLLAVALSMDAFAVSIGLGAKRAEPTLPLAIKAGLYFGIFQALMPLIGYMAGVGVFVYIESFDHWIAFLLLAVIGGKMIYESFTEEIGEDIARVTNKMLLILAIATSIDALAAGFTLTLFELVPLLSVALIGVTTFVFSMAGVYFGDRTGTFLERQAELLGGLILIVIGLKILFTHLGVL